ncbi:hypothetical protein JAAARDRAFT_31712 [Jaapia argillacea MUCL 33604]|uniref:Phosphatidylinositol N-acetylglucosaminyltransferase subunit H conserved domain-containing protein n=1 Tax=Jaapia argillacea MUCL 33604 TaxID=933084 RepID=A0A067Q0Y8_9AGAM|nr:hypothetical protein JAAARDRAFT_31712 [Jaapia argillacea MUCL 33604]
MNASRESPLPLTHPELSIHHGPGFCEYRVENWYLARDGSGRIVKGYNSFSWPDAVIAAVLAFFWVSVRDSPKILLALGIALTYGIWCKFSQILWESVIAIPPHGIQLETHRGYPSIPLTVSRRFIPAIILHDFVINEGIRRWDVRHYLVALKTSHTGDVALDVAYENILPHFPVLFEVYRGIYATFLQDPGLEEAKK